MCEKKNIRGVGPPEPGRYTLAPALRPSLGVHAGDSSHPMDGAARIQETLVDDVFFDLAEGFALDLPDTLAGRELVIGEVKAHPTGFSLEDLSKLCAVAEDI